MPIRLKCLPSSLFLSFYNTCFYQASNYLFIFPVGGKNHQWDKNAHIQLEYGYYPSIFLIVSLIEIQEAYLFFHIYSL